MAIREPSNVFPDESLAGLLGTLDANGLLAAVALAGRPDEAMKAYA
ncbi:MAG: hypothetical protein ACRDMH_00370 [Solirubrobacterales bacterium]